MNLNEVAEKIAECEEKKEEVNIAQIKEILKCTFEVLNEYDEEEIIETIQEYKENQLR